MCATARKGHLYVEMVLKVNSDLRFVLGLLKHALCSRLVQINR